MQATITAAPLPTNFKGTPQQWLEAFLDRLEVTFEGNTFVISDIQPIGNEGPWLKNGTQWWVWNESTSEYMPLDVSASVTNQIFIGDIANGAPDSSVYQLWLQLNGTQVNGLFYFAGATAGWVKQASELVPGAVQVNMLAPQNPGSLITFDVNRNPFILAPGNPGTFLQSTGNGLSFGSPQGIHGIPTFINPVTVVSVTGPLTGGSWSTVSTLAANGVPATASAIILQTVAKAAAGGTGGTFQMRPNSAGSIYNLATCENVSASDISTTTQGIFPFVQASGILSFDWSVDNSGTYTGSEIVLVGYIS